MKALYILVAAAALTQAAPQQPASTKGNPAAREEAAKGAAALRESDWDGAVVHYGKAVELDPDFFDAHEQYVFVSTAGPKNYNNEPLFRELEAKYLRWSKEHPDKAVYLYSLGHLNFYKKPEQAEKYFQQAVKLDPKFAPAWDMLGIMAEAQGKLAEEREDMRKAVEAWPDNVRYARHEAGAWEMAPFADFWKASMALIAHHPEEGANWLSFVSYRAPTYRDIRATLELLHEKYMPQGASSLSGLFQLDLREDPAKALKLANELAGVQPANKQWTQLSAYAKAVVDARAAIASAKPTEAIDLLQAVTLPPRTDHRVLDIARADAMAAAGQTSAAYSNLVKAFAVTPNDELRASLVALGAKAGKEPKQVDADVFAQRSAAAKPGIPFATTTYPDNRPLKLADYAGKVFLVNFWYPLCGPCRGEFPFLQTVLDKYKDRGFQIVAINVHPNEDSWVMPLIKGWNLGFLPVHGGEDLMTAYKVRGAPSNFLYGRDGKIYYVPGPVNTLDARRELELQVEGLLAQ